MRTAIFARFSTDKQSGDSTADQVARCRKFADRQSWRVVEGLVFEAEGISGASRHNAFRAPVEADGSRFDGRPPHRYPGNPQTASGFRVGRG